MPEARRRTARSSKSSSNTEVKITKRSQSSHDEDRDRERESRHREREHETRTPEVEHNEKPDTSINNDTNAHDQTQEQVSYFNDDTKQLLNMPSDHHENADEIMNEHEDEDYDEHNDYESDAESEEYEEEEYDELDLTGERLYDILSPFLETNDGEGVADVLLGIRESLDEHTEAIRELTQTLRDYFNRRATAVSRSSKSSGRQ